MTASMWPWATILLLGVWHGVNPGMGWLFAVALGMQEQKGRAVWAALGPLALGHGLAVAGAVAIALVVGVALPPWVVRWVVAGLLVALGAARLIRHRHPRWAGMRVTPRELTMWSFLMASAHGAGLMVLPFVLRAASERATLGGAHAGHVIAGLGGGADLSVGLATTLLHTAGYLAVTGGLAGLVYGRLGLRFLRSLWINLDLVWGGALIVTGAMTPLF
jgi:hypothetical protein